MQAGSIDFDKYITSYPDFPKLGIFFCESGLSSGTGDNFVSAPPEMNSDLVDMRAYALSKICQQKAFEFYCFKFMSDNANFDVANDWVQQLALGARLFSNEVFQNYSSFR